MEKNLIIVLFSLSFFTACTSKNLTELPPWEQGRAVKITELRPANVNTTTVTVTLSAKKYAQALAEGGNLNAARLVELYSRHKNLKTPPEYRVFDVQKGGIYEMLRLKTADVIIAAGGYVIPNQAIFWQYLNMMKDLGSGSLEIVRSGRSFNIEYKFEK